MTTIATDMRVTVESAKRIRFEQASGIAATNVQDAITQSAAIPQILSPTSVSSSPFVPSNGDTVLWVDTTSARIINLPTGAARGGVPLEVKDITGNGAVNTITINAAGGETVDGLAAWVINIDYGGVKLYPKPSGGWTTAPSGP